MNRVVETLGKINTLVNCAGIGNAEKTYSSKKGAHELVTFIKVIQVNLIGTFNAIRLTPEKISSNEPNEDGERGGMINTASVSAFEGQIFPTVRLKGALLG